MSSFAPATRPHERGDKLHAAADMKDVLRKDRRVNGWNFILFGIRFSDAARFKTLSRCRSTSQFLEFAGLPLHCRAVLARKLAPQ
jgi:hypothetical protein